MESFSAETNSMDQQYWDQPQVILSMVLYSLTFLLGLPGNGLVLWIIGLKMRRTVNTVWFMHLTLADFICCLSLPFSLANLALQGHWPYGRFLCKLLPSVIILNMFASVFLLTAISLDRCLLVLQPVWCQNHRRVRTAHAMCGCIWAVALVMCIPVFIYRDVATIGHHTICYYPFDFADYHFDLLENETQNDAIDQLPDHPSQTLQTPSGNSLPMNSTELPSPRPNYNLFKPADVVSSTIPSGFPIEDHRRNPPNDSDAFLYSDYNNSFYRYGEWVDYNESQYAYDNQVATPQGAITFTRLVMGFLLPSLLMIVCYSLIIFRMRQGRFAKSRSKTFRVAMVVVVVFLVCWAPYHIIGVLLLFVDSETPFERALNSWDSVCLALASANSCFNPFLYAFLGKDFRKQAKQSMQGILEAAFSEEATRSISFPPSKVSLDKTSISTAV